MQIWFNYNIQDHLTVGRFSLAEALYVAYNEDIEADIHIELPEPNVETNEDLT